MPLETRCDPIERKIGDILLSLRFFAHIENGFAIGSARSVASGLYRLQQLLLYSLMDLTYVWEARQKKESRGGGECSIYMTAAISSDAVASVTAEDKKVFSSYLCTVT